MRAAASLLPLLLAVAACNEAPRQAETNDAATEVEALPPDESVVTPTDELANGAAEPTNGREEAANTSNAAY